MDPNPYESPKVPPERKRKRMSLGLVFMVVSLLNPITYGLVYFKLLPSYMVWVFIGITALISIVLALLPDEYL